MKIDNRSVVFPPAAPARPELGSSGWKRALAMLLVCSMLGSTPPGMAQDPASNQATLNFVGAEIESVVKAIGHYTGTTFVIDPRVKGTISVVSEKPVTKAQAFELLTQALRLQGYAAVNTGGVVKIVPEADAKLQAGPIQGGNLRGDQIATQVFRLNYESAASLVPVLRPLISPNNTINANPGTNSLVITDYADNLRRLSRIIASLDAPATSEPEIIPIKYAIASDVASAVNRMLEGGTTTTAPGGQGGAPVGSDRISLLADVRTNSVILRAPSASRMNLAKSLIAKLDQPTANPGNVHVVYLKNAEATKLAQTLRAVVAGESGAATSQPLQQQGQQLQQTTQQQGMQQTQLGQTQPLQQQQQTPLPTGGVGGYIQADPATNTLIITASETVYRNLRAVIDMLDARRAQVYVESLIVELTSDKASEFGLQWAGLSGNSSSNYRVGGVTGFGTAGSNLINLAVAQQSDTLGTSVAPGNGLNLAVFRQINGQLGLGVLARALESGGNANILSMPNLITLDNEEARIIVGQNVPFVTGQFTTNASGSSNPFQTIERKDVGLSLRVRPQISEGGTVKMVIYQETSSVQAGATVSDLRTNKRSIETNVLVEDGDIIVLGGLIEDTLTDNLEQVPGLGNLPVIGNLFKYQSRTRGKKNLMVFLRPTVIRSSEQGNHITADRYDYIRSQQFMAAPRENFALTPPETPVLPPLENGRPVGGGVLAVEPEVRRPLYEGPPGSTPPATPAGLGPDPLPAPPPAGQKELYFGRGISD